MPVIPIRRRTDLAQLTRKLANETASGELVGVVAVTVYRGGDTDWYAVLEGRDTTVKALGEMEICRTAIAELYACGLEEQSE
jgi:hypothetical protein